MHKRGGPIKSSFKIRYSTILLFLAVIFIMVVIFMFSAENDIQSTGTSDSVLRIVLSVLKRDFDNMSVSEQETLLLRYSHLIRKTAHFSIYALLGLLLYATCASASVSPGISIASSVFVTLLYAASDEFHQLYVPGRSGSIRDVLLDTLGGITGVFICRLIQLLIYKHQKSKHQQ